MLAGVAAVVAAASPVSAAAASPSRPERTIGVTVAARQHTGAGGRVTEQSPSLRRWQAELRTQIGVVASFISWGNGVDPVVFAHAVTSRGPTPLITWESWAAAPNGDIQPPFTNEAVAAGRWDPYITRVARGLQALGKPIYIRLDHEMNGDWYPWHRNPIAYVAAWRHVVAIFRREGATNVKWIWAPNAISWTTSGWLDEVRPYWPGEAYVDYIGLTLEERYATMAIYGQHLDLIHATWPGKQVVLPETNAMTRSYMRALVTFVTARPWIRTVTWFEQPSFGSLLDRKAMALQFGQLVRRIANHVTVR